MNLQIQDQVIFEKSAKSIRQGKGSLFQNGARKIGYPHVKNELGPLFHTMYRNQLKME
jgi:hypothetical protein